MVHTDMEMRTRQGINYYSFLTRNGLGVTNTFFQHADIHKGTWQHPRSKLWHMIDLIIVRQRHLWRVRDTRVYRGVDCWSDHHFVCCRLDVEKPRKKKRKNKPKRRRANTGVLKERSNTSRKCWQHKHERKQEQQPHQKRRIIVGSGLDAVEVEIESEADRDVQREEVDESKDLWTQLQCNIDINRSEYANKQMSRVEREWAAIRDAMNTTIDKMVGYEKAKPPPDWWTDNKELLQSAIDEKKQAFLALQDAKRTHSPHIHIHTVRYRKAKTRVRLLVKQTKNEWWTAKGKELSQAHETQDWKTLFGFWKKLDSKRTVSRGTEIRDADGNMLTNEEEQRVRWAQHFQKVLNQNSKVQTDAVNAVTEREEQHWLADTPTIEEVTKAISLLTNNKAASTDEITAEVLKAGGPITAQAMHNLICIIWKDEVVPQEWIDAVLVPIPKKGDITKCDNWRGISILSVAGKVFTKLLDQRLAKFADSILSETQAGFRRGRGCIDMVFVTRQLAEKAREFRIPLFSVFFDLKKAYDTVNREGLWKLLAKYGMPSKTVRILQALYKDMKAVVEVSGSITDPFDVLNGLRQGCILSCNLFNLFFDAVVAEALKGYEGKVQLKWLPDRSLHYNRKKLRRTTQVIECRFADDMMGTALTPTDLQELIDRFAKAAERWGLTVSVPKTEVLIQPTPSDMNNRTTTSQPSQFTINNEPLTEVPSFRYLGSTMSNDANMDVEIKARIAKGCKVFNALKGSVMNSTGLSVAAKVHVFKGTVIPALLYGAETWTVKLHHENKLESFIADCLRVLFKQPRFTGRTTASLFKQANLPPVRIMLRKMRMRWLGHVARMDDERLPKQLLYADMDVGTTRAPGGQRKRWKDCVMTDLKSLNIDTHTWQNLAKDRQAWRAAVDKGLDENEKEIENRIVRNRNIRKQKEIKDAIVCPICSKQVTSERTLKSHIAQTHTDKAEERRQQRLKQKQQKQNNPQINLCPIKDCSKQITNIKGLKVHVHKVHNITTKEEKERLVLKFLQSSSSSSTASRTKAVPRTATTTPSHPIPPPPPTSQPLPSQISQNQPLRERTSSTNSSSVPNDYDRVHSLHSRLNRRR